MQHMLFVIAIITGTIIFVLALVALFTALTCFRTAELRRQLVSARITELANKARDGKLGGIVGAFVLYLKKLDDWATGDGTASTPPSISALLAAADKQYPGWRDKPEEPAK